MTACNRCGNPAAYRLTETDPDGAVVHSEPLCLTHSAPFPGAEHVRTVATFAPVGGAR